MFDKIFKNNFEQEQTTYDLKFDNTLKQFIVINRAFNNCRDEVIISGSYKSQLLKITDGLNNWLSEHATITGEHYFVVTGEYPNLAISEKLYICKDNYKYCLKDIGVNHIDLYENNKVFKTYEAANNEVIKLLQRKDSFTVPKNFAGNLVISDAPYISVELENKKTKRSTKKGK